MTATWQSAPAITARWSFANYTYVWVYYQVLLTHMPSVITEILVKIKRCISRQFHLCFSQYLSGTTVVIWVGVTHEVTFFSQLHPINFEVTPGAVTVRSGYSGFVHICQESWVHSSRKLGGCHFFIVTHAVTDSVTVRSSCVPVGSGVVIVEDIFIVFDIS